MQSDVLTLISVMRVVHHRRFCRGNYPTRVIQGATATVGGCPEGTIQHGLYRVLQLQWVVVQRELSNTGYTGYYSYSGWLSRGNYPTRVIQGATATVGGCPEGTIQHGLHRVLQLQWVVVQREPSYTGYAECYSYIGWFSRGNYPTRVIQGVATVDGYPEATIQHGLYRVLQLHWVVFQRELSNTGYTGCSYSGWLSRSNYPTRVKQGATPTVGGCTEEITQHGFIQGATATLGSCSEVILFTRKTMSETRMTACVLKQGPNT